MYPNFNSISFPKSIFLASTPESIISILVSTPTVLSPFISIYLAIYSASEVVISAFAGITAKIIVLSSII